MKNRYVSLLLVVLLGLALLFLAGCRPVVGPEPATPEPVTEAPIEIVTSTPSAVETAAPVDASWERIKTSGKIIVGTSGDYSPFSYYNAQNQLDGFDIALMRQLGEYMGIQVEFVDYPFEFLSLRGD